MAAKDKEPNIWITVAKLVIGAVLIIGGTGFVLWYLAEDQKRSQPSAADSSTLPKGWGIVTDSPLRSNR